MTIDFECNFKSKESIENNLKKVLNIFDKYNVNSTFFIVGKLIEKYIDIIKIIPKKYEIAAHGFKHVALNRINEKEIQKEVVFSKKSILKLRKECLGFRAPYNIIHPLLPQILKKEGFIYDSSICRSFYPGRYNNRRVSNQPYIASANLKNKGNFILEFPISSYSALKLPFGLSFIKAFENLYPLNKIENNSVFYMHDYDINSKNYPKDVSFFTKIFLNKNKKSGLRILKQILESDYNFISCKDYIKIKYPKLLN